MGSQGEQINELLTKLGYQAAPVGDGIEVEVLGEKVYTSTKKELCMLKQELRVISTQHHIDCTLVPKTGSENCGNIMKPKPGNTNLSSETPHRIVLTALPSTPVDVCAHGTPLVHIQELQSKVNVLASKQVLLEQERENESRRCSILVGNVPEQAGETFADVEDKVEGVFRDNLNIACRTSQVRRLGKKQEGKHRLLLAYNGR